MSSVPDVSKTIINVFPFALQYLPMKVLRNLSLTIRNKHYPVFPWCVCVWKIHVCSMCVSCVCVLCVWGDVCVYIVWCVCSVCLGDVCVCVYSVVVCVYNVWV